MWCPYVALLVTNQLAVATLVALLSGPPRDGLHTDGALQTASAQMLGDEGVIVVDVQLGALATPARSLGDGQRHNEVALYAILDGLQHQGGGLVHVGFIASRGKA